MPYPEAWSLGRRGRCVQGRQHSKMLTRPLRARVDGSEPTALSVRPWQGVRPQAGPEAPRAQSQDRSQHEGTWFWCYSARTPLAQPVSAS